MHKLIWIVLVCCCFQQVDVVGQVNLLPKPTLVKSLPGSLTIYGDLVVDSSQIPDGGTAYLDWVIQRFSKRCVNYSTIGAQVRFQRMTNGLPNSYTIAINRTIDIAYTTPASGMHAISTLFQLMEVCTDRVELPRCFIQDSPSYAYRGVFIDGCRRFYTVDEMKALLNLMAVYKLTHLTWKLAGNHVFRLPLSGDSLLSVNHDRYTLGELREINAHANHLKIQLVPVFDLFTCSDVLMNSIDGLSCEHVSKRHQEQGEFSYCAYEPAREQLKLLLTQMLSIFTADSWSLGRLSAQCVSNRETCTKCQKVMREEGVSHTGQLMAIIYDYLAAYLKENGKIIMDYGVQGGASFVCAETPSEIAQALKEQRLIVNALPEYFDFTSATAYRLNNLAAKHTLGVISSRDVYHVPLQLDQSIHVQQLLQGAQCQLLADSTTSFEGVMNMLLPRLLVFAERMWSRELPSFSNMIDRLERYHIPLLDSLKLNCETSYRGPDFKCVSTEDGIGWVMQSVHDTISYSYVVENPFSDSESFELVSGDTLSMSRLTGSAILYNVKVVDQQKSTQIRLPITTHGALGIPIGIYSNGYFLDSTLRLTDGMVGTNADWFVNENDVIEMELDFEAKKHITSLHIGFYADESLTYFLPDHVELYTGKRGKRWKKRTAVGIDQLVNNRIYLHPDTKTRRIKIKVYAHQLPCSVTNELKPYRLTAMDELIVITGD